MLVNKQDVIDALLKEEPLVWNDDDKDALGEHTQWVYDLATVEAVQPKNSGRWLWEVASNGWADHICSNCGYRHNTDIHVRITWVYCPMCGSFNGREE